MGIPSYFSYIVKNHPEIIRLFTKNIRQKTDAEYENNITEFIINNLYLDCNSIIYDAVHNTKFSEITGDSSKIIISKVIAKIEEYIAVIAPTTCVYIAFDGVAPLAKLEQQRERRYKSWYQSDITQSIMNLNKADVWNTTAITPGTLFMSDLNKSIKKHFELGIRVNGSNNGCKVIISTSDEAGEGEHKLFAFIRENPDLHDENTRTIVYGLDADLIMLSINHLPVCPNIFLFRETPHFIKTIDRSLEPDKTYLLDIPLLVKQIHNEMCGVSCVSGVGVSGDSWIVEDVNIVYDYIFICFFLGNDFMPHFPAINIRTGGIHKMMNAYKATFGVCGSGDGSGNIKKYLTDGKKIIWKNVRTMVDFLAKNELQFFKDEMKLRDKKANFYYPTETPEEMFTKFEAIPNYERELEKHINPYKEGWQNRYYQCLFGVDVGDLEKLEEFKKNVCVNYLTGLEWTMKYYTSGCPDWRWCYKYHYPPLLEDLIHHVPYFERDFLTESTNVPVSPLVQLCYVLPKPSLNLLPEKLLDKIIKERGHNDWYSTDYDFVWAFCKYFWESHVQLPEIPIDELENIVNEYLLER
jgi:5'-3' exonuclease